MVVSLGIGPAQPLRPSSNCSRRCPHRGWLRRSSQIAASTSGLVWAGWAWGRCDRSDSPARPTSRYQRAQRCTACLDTPNRSATSITGTPACTSSTARYRCSVTVNSTNTRQSVTHHVEPFWALSTGARNELGQLFGWFHVSECFARPVVEAAGDVGDVVG